MARFPYLTYFSHVLPLDYELSLTPYEIISKLLRWLDELTKTVNIDSAAIQDLKERVKALEDNGFTNEQLREVLDDMIADGEFDFLVDLITAKTELWDIVGVKPYAQVLPEKVGVSIAGYSMQSMAMGNINGVKVGMFCFAHSTDNTLDGSLIMTYNMVSGEVMGYNDQDFFGHVNGCAFNPVNNKFYITPGADYNNIVVLDEYCQEEDRFSTSDPSYKAGGIAFNKTTGAAYIMWYSQTGSDDTVIINEITDITGHTGIDSQTYNKTNTWHRGTTTSVGRQDIYCDDIYLYLPTYWHKDRTSRNIGTRNRQDVFTISNLEYVRTQYVDMRNEVNGGEYFEGSYYIGINIQNAGIICEAAVVCNNAYNSAYDKISQMADTEFSYGPFIVYANGNSTAFLADGSEAHPFNRLLAMQLFIKAYNRYAGVEMHLSGDFTCNGEITNISFRNSRQRLIFIGNGVDTCILPKLTLDNCSRIEMEYLTVKGWTTDYILYAFDVGTLALFNVKFEKGGTQALAAVIRTKNSYVEVIPERVVGGQTISGHIGFDGTTPTRYVLAEDGVDLQGSFYRDYDVTGSGTYITMSEFGFTRSSGLSGAVIGVVDDAGLNISGTLTASSDKAANSILLTAPSDNLQELHTRTIPRGAAGYIIAAGSDGNAYPLNYAYDSNTIITLNAITSDTTLTINSTIPLDKIII